MKNRTKAAFKWQANVWRVIPALVVAYLATGTFYAFTHLSDPWLRAFAPVIAIVVFTGTNAVTKTIWIKYQQKRYSSGARES